MQWSSLVNQPFETAVADIDEGAYPVDTAGRLVVAASSCRLPLHQQEHPVEVEVLRRQIREPCFQACKAVVAVAAALASS